MRKSPKRRTRKSSRQTGSKRRSAASCDDPYDHWDPFEVFVMLMAASRAMEKLREDAAVARAMPKTTG